MKCLVTGATGFLGTNLVHELVEQGWEVRACGMHGSETRYIESLPIEIRFADITDPAEVDDLVKGCEVVFHVAADTSFWKKHYDRQRRINVDGTCNVAEACRKYGVRRLVHTSTIDVLGYNPTGGSFDEDTGHFNFIDMGYNYGETKLEAEVRLKAYASADLEIVYIYPGFMVGPFDYTLQLGRVLFDLKQGKLPGYPPGGGSFCHVRQVAAAHVAAAARGRPGEAYLCAGMPHTNLSYATVFRQMAAAVGARAPRYTIPRAAMVAWGYFCELTASFTNTPPEMNPGQARYMSLPQYAISGKAIRELGYVVPPVEDCIADALAWYRANGYDI